MSRFDQNIADRLWSNASTLLADRQHALAIYQLYARWEKLRPNNIGFLKWMAANCYKHTKDAQLHLSYMKKYTSILKQQSQDHNAVLFTSIKMIIFEIEHSLSTDVGTYKSRIEELHLAIEKFNTENENLCKKNTVLEPPINLFHAMMILRPKTLVSYLRFFYMAKKLPKPLFATQKQQLPDLKIGFVWLGVKTDPSYKCLKTFISRLAYSHNVYIYFDDTDLEPDVKKELTNVTIKCVAELTDKEVATAISEDGIKILINNWWDRKRGFELFALRPAPAIVNFMGVPGRYLNPNLIQYSVTDRYIHDEMIKLDMINSARFEKSLIMPIYYQLTSAFENVTPVQRKSLKRIGLLARPLKLSPLEAYVIKKILQKFDDIQIVVISSESDLPRVTDALMRNDLLPLYFNRITTAYQTKLEKYNELLQSIDLCLDTFAHFGALSTGIEIVSTGCPLISVAGPTFFSCHSSSILKSLDVHEYLLCDDEDHVVSRISEFIRKPKLFQKVSSEVIDGLKKSRINDIDYRVSLFQQMLEKLNKNIDVGMTEDIVIEESKND